MWDFQDFLKTRLSDASEFLYDKIDVHALRNRVDLVKGEKKGIANLSVKIIIPFLYEEIEEHQYKNITLFKVKKEGKWGILDYDGDKKTECIYDEIGLYYSEDYFSLDIILVKKGNKSGLIKTSGKIIIPCQYDEIYFSNRELIIVKNENTYGVLDSVGHEIIPCVYNHIYYNAEINLLTIFKGEIKIIDKQKKYFGQFKLLNTKGVFDVKGNYDKIKPFNSRGYARVEKSNKLGLIDTLGNEIIPCKYDWISSYFTNKIIRVFKGKIEFDEFTLNDKFIGKFGFINNKGAEVIPVIYEDIKTVSGEKLKVKLNGKWGILSATGEQLIPPKYDWVGNWIEGWSSNKYILVFKGIIDPNDPYKRKGKYGYVDTLGNEITKIIYDNLEHNNGSSIIKVKLNEKWGAINLQGEQVVPYKYDWIDSDYNENLLKVFIGKIKSITQYEYFEYHGKYGFVDNKGVEVIPCQFQEASNFGKEKAEVEKDGKKYFINKKGVKVK